MEFKPPFIDVTYHREEYVYKELENGLLEKKVVKKRPERRFNVYMYCGFCFYLFLYSLLVVRLLILVMSILLGNQFMNIKENPFFLR
jgi:hypothetical protein